MSKPKKVTHKDVLDKIYAIAKDVKKSIEKKKAPQVSMPLRSLTNVEYDEKKGYMVLLDKEKIRTMSANTMKTFAQTLMLMNESKRLTEAKDRASKREAYYVSKNWGAARFTKDADAFTVLDDVEAMLRVNREQMGFIPGEKGGNVTGALTILDSGVPIDCTKFGSGSYSIPGTVEQFTFKTKAKFVLVVETAALFDRLNNHKYWKIANCVIIGMGGVPTRATRRFIRKLSDECKLPVYVFTDGDPYAYGSIYRTLKVGSGNAAHINEFFCVPQAKFIGVTPQDIIDYKLDEREATHPLKDVDFKKIKDLVKNDPFFQKHKKWQKALRQMVAMKVRAEQQAFAAHDYNFVWQKYLPEKLNKPETWLP